MPDPAHRPPLLVGEAHGRETVPLRDLPPGIMAVTLPRVVKDGDDVIHVRVPKDRKQRIKPRQVDLVADHPVSPYDPPPTLTPRQLAKVLETKSSKRWSTIEADLGDNAWQATVDLIRCGAVILRCDVINVTGYSPRSWTLTHSWAELAEDKLAELKGRSRPEDLHRELLALMSGIPQLADEKELLANTPPGRVLKVPEGTATRAEDWRVYELAVRAASTWWPAQGQPRKITAKELAGRSLRDTKSTWTPARQQAFSNLIGVPFDQAVDKADTDLRIRGPLQWRVGTVIANTAACDPWLSLPARGVHALGMISCDARGVFVVENEDTFEQICKIPEITDTWLCIWGKGYATNGLIDLLCTLDGLPLVAWGDLDAHGIRIISNLADRVERPVTPIAMTVDLYRAGVKYFQPPEKLTGNRELAIQLAQEALPALRDLAGEIARTGGEGCEQETLYDEVLPALPGLLEAVLLSKRG
ncbi:Wadjet anti-phage system protein JetD domain-containing protein [Kitasatospora sp. NRRL B-11411]|uniref:Wadjet anti-phage system protein JetD domain-containing protein n=1 Tax=Kitasatospora sp. NRRL B-11411 TaxID=1463822 RepID=UPI0004C2D3C0|nr:Wadjet anti-phage system protein JetD domain-containing protein [Kitasatospora sp. NRRL B-11411]